MKKMLIAAVIVGVVSAFLIIYSTNIVGEPDDFQAPDM